ncbi:hypothetical protein [Emticicia agri]|uniref:Uncharacterized protein n=1 Tax=Emticicia agri TaxID=2492393 RepID=A0A4Q5LU33_9BACT|nr:hypothetical protein [Emticicia agri]RYU93186.1 hypothetical protein EWM59_23435 [Emticicia agri]
MSIAVKSQNCQTENKELFFVEIDIRGVSINPILMNGLTSFVKVSEYNNDSPMSFLRSFYRLGSYSPDIELIGYSLFKECQNEGFNARSMSLLNNKIFKKSIKKQLLLKTGETVFLRISKIKADFLELDKDNKIIPSNSNEISLSEINEIKMCYIPLKIYYYKKPRKKDIL